MFNLKLKNTVQLGMKPFYI